MEKIKEEMVTVAGGCFWCMEAIFKRLKGIISVMPGYAGGTKKNPTYEEVCTGQTGHAEAIEIIFDPKIISFEKILEVFFHLHDPTTLNRQGPDVGTQYRSAIFYHDNEQKKIAEKLKQEIQGAVTEITAYTNFYPAEDYHRDYYAKNSSQPYCQYTIGPKIQKLTREYRNDLKSEYVKS